MTTKTKTFVCIKCKRDQPTEDFRNDPKVGRGHRAVCKACEKQRKAEMYTRTPMQQPAQPKRDVFSETKSLANSRAIHKLIENHQSEFKKLMRDEWRKLGMDIEKQNWITLI